MTDNRAMTPKSEENEQMKSFILALALAVISTAAYATTCRTNCYWIGNQQYCTTTCDKGWDAW